MKKTELKNFKLPDKPGVYFFLKKREILYIGKASSLSDRIKSYFSNDLIETRGPLILDMVTQASSIKHQITDSVIEALILEAGLIKKYQPKYNTKEKDNKSFNLVCITDEKIPKILIERERNINKKLQKVKYKNIFGPFPNGLQLKEAMKIIRRIFPYVDEQSSKKNNEEFYQQLGLTPGINKKNSFLVYKKNLINIKLFFQGKKKNIIKNLKKEMMKLAQKREFEKANEIKKKIFALKHINDIALVREDNRINIKNKDLHFRIEAFDIAHLSGKNMVGGMVVMKDGYFSKIDYRKFIIKTIEISNDTGALAEILKRRFSHEEWDFPNLVVVDGGPIQLNKARRVLKDLNIKIPVVSVVKDDKHKAKAILGDSCFIDKFKKDILLINLESHRFTINFHKEKRANNFIS